MTPDQVRSHLERYLDLRRALGFKIDGQISRLRDFAAFIAARRLYGPDMAQGALDWACSSSRPCGPAGQAHRLSLARLFLSHLRAIDSHVRVPDSSLLPRSVRPKPHIYSDGEIETLLTAETSLGPRGS
jgi:integrase/recombinase XerD